LDAGVKHKQVDDNGDKENERPKSKKQKQVVQQRKGGSSSKKPTAKKATSKKLQAPTSHAYITDSEDSD
jgi:hypothetical protein